MINLLKKDMKITIKTKKLIITLLIFIFIWGSFSYLFKDYMAEQRLLDQVSIGLVDEEDSPLTRLLLDNFKNNDAFTGLFHLTIASEEDLLEQYANNELSAIIYLPTTFTDSLFRFENTPLYMTLNPNFPLKNTVLESIMSSYSNYIKAVDVGIYSMYRVLKSEGIPTDDLNDINNKISLNMVMTALNRNELIDYQPIDTFPSSGSLAYFTYTILILIMIFIATSGSSAYHDEIQNGCLHRFICTGQNLLYYTLSKFVVLLFYIMLLMLPFLLINSQLQNHLSLLEHLKLLVLFTVAAGCFVSLSLTLGLLLSKKKVSHLFSTLITLILGLLGGQFLPLQVMPKVIQNIASFTPNYWLLRFSLYINNQLMPKGLTLFIFIALGFILINQMIQIHIIKRTKLWIE